MAQYSPCSDIIVIYITERIAYNPLAIPAWDIHFLTAPVSTVTSVLN
jgi:hypothetical protein